MIVNKNAVVALERNFRKIFTEALHGATTSAMWPKFASKFSTTAGSIDYSWLAAIPGMKQLKGTAEIANLELVNWTIENDEWHDTIGVKVKDIERDQLGAYAERLRLLADAGARHPDELLATALAGGFSAKDYTKKNFFDVAKKHFPGAKASFDNKLTTELAASSFEEARIAIRTQKIVFPDNSETKLNLGRDLVLVVSPHNESVARTILKSEQIDGSTNINRDTASIEVWGYLDGPEWFLMDRGFPVKPFAFQEEKPVSLAGVTDIDDSYVLLNKEYLYQVYGRYALGYFLPQLIIGSTGVDAAP